MAAEITFKKTLDVKNDIEARLSDKKGVIGFGVGRINDEDDGSELCVQIFINKNDPQILDDEELSLLIEERSKNNREVQVRLIQISPVKAQEDEAELQDTLGAGVEPYTTKKRPMPPGYSIGIPEAGAGTAGLIVVKKEDNSKVFILSNNHVLIQNNRSFPSIIQQGATDGGTLSDNKIGSACEFIPLKDSPNVNTVDGALARPDRAADLDPDYPGVGEVPGHYNQVVLGWEMEKVGKRTGHGTGKITSISWSGIISGRKWENQVVVTNSEERIGLPGDSGQVWLKKDDHHAGLVHHAGTSDGDISISYPIHWALTAFKCAVAKKAGKKGKNDFEPGEIKTLSNVDKCDAVSEINSHL